MALRLSTGLKDNLLGKKALVMESMTGTTISFGDGTGTDSRDQILDSGNGLAGFTINDKINVNGSTSNDGSYPILSVAAGAIEVAAGSLTTESAGDQVVLASARGGSWSDLFRNGVIRIYSGVQPTSADAAETGTLLAVLTLSSGSFSGGTATNGLNFDAVTSSVLAKASGETWSGVGIAAGVAGWARFYDNDYTTGASTSAIRFDGSVGVSGTQFNLPQTDIAVGTPITLDSISVYSSAS